MAHLDISGTPNETVVNASWSNIPDSSSYDYVAICVEASGPDEYLTYTYASGSSTDTCSIDVSGGTVETGGRYLLRYISGNDSSVVAKSEVFQLGGNSVVNDKTTTVSSPVMAEVSTKSSCSPVFDTPVIKFDDSSITGTWSGIASPSSSDYLTVSEQDSAPSEYVTYSYVSGESKDSLTLDVTGCLEEGTAYVLRYITEGGQTVAQSSFFLWASPRKAVEIPQPVSTPVPLKAVSLKAELEEAERESAAVRTKMNMQRLQMEAKMAEAKRTAAKTKANMQRLRQESQRAQESLRQESQRTQQVCHMTSKLSQLSTGTVPTTPNVPMPSPNPKSSSLEVVRVPKPVYQAPPSSKVVYSDNQRRALHQKVVMLYMSAAMKYKGGEAAYWTNRGDEAENLITRTDHLIANGLAQEAILEQLNRRTNDCSSCGGYMWATSYNSFMCDDNSCRRTVQLSPPYSGPRVERKATGPQLSAKEKEEKYHRDWKSRNGPDLARRFKSKMCGAKSKTREAQFCSEHSTDSKCVICGLDHDQRWHGEKGEYVWVCRSHENSSGCCICGKSSGRMSSYEQKACRLCANYVGSGLNKCCWRR